MKLKRTLLLIFFLIAGTVVGALIASAAQDTAFAWLAFSRTVGLSPNSPLILDLSVAKFSFSFSVSISVAQVLTIGLSILVYNLILRARK